jgi:hypothetical protein
MTTITYQQVFSVTNIGDELVEGQVPTYRSCPAVVALRGFLTANTFLSESSGRVQGTGPLYRPWDGNTHEYNRHHAGLAVDVMLDPKNDAHVALGQQLVILFRRNQTTMRWRSMIYQNVTFSPGGGSDGGDHYDHIHIDWHNPANVKWKENITSVPLRKSGAVINLPLKQVNRIAASITWPAEADIDFSSATTLKTEISELLGRHGRSELTKITWNASALAAAQTTTLNLLRHQLPGRWYVTIGDWNGLFIFEAAGNVAWSEDTDSPRHSGRWSVNGNRLEWKFRDVGDFRTFTAPLPLSQGRVSGSIFPVGQGWFSMSRDGGAMA